ncbi:MAG: arsenic metallochaperone ArsD family protein [Syntrophomonadaceae bacterium]|nr:arsenic metallochaperone ArsD family protein [Syntrophomonadaceae bacterium]
MKKIEVFEIPVGCCAPISNPAEAEFKELLLKLKKEQLQVEVISMTQHPQKFLGNSVISSIAQQEGRNAFPVTLVDGELLLKGRYPQYGDLK